MIHVHDTCNDTDKIILIIHLAWCYFYSIEYVKLSSQFMSKVFESINLGYTVCNYVYCEKENVK